MNESGQSGRAGEFFLLAEALRAFKTGPLSDDPSDRALARKAGVSPTTVGDWLRGKRFPQDVGKVLIVVRMVREAAAALSIASPAGGPAGLLDDDRWRAAHQQEAQRRAGVVSDAVQRARAAGVLAGSAARVRAGEVDPRRLGVHSAISVPGVPDEVPPEYIPRDVDTAEFGVWTRVTAAAQRGGFVLLVGGSSVGKTRSAIEAVRTLLPDWWLVHPAGPVEITALAAAPSSRTVVWLDELQRYLDGEHGLTGAVVRVLLSAPYPLVIIGTLWPDRYTAYTTVPAPGEPDLYAQEREVLHLADIVRISPVFSPAEQDRARAAAARDPRLKIAIDMIGYGLTQTLAAAPQLVARWQDAQTASPYGWAVLTAALDAARLGARTPLSADFLRAAAVDYCTGQQQAEARENWFEQALAYATGKLHGAVAALSPSGAGIMGRVAGYTVADYLIQYATQERRSARVPASTWEAILDHIRDPADAERLAHSAINRLLHRYGIPLSQYATHAGDGHTARELADLLAGRGDLDELRARADAGGEAAARELVWVLARRGDLDELRARADTGGEAAAELARLLADSGDLGELRARADAGGEAAARELADLLAKRGDLEEAVEPLRARAHAGDEAAVELVGLLDWRVDLDEAVELLRARADAGDEDSAGRLADLLARRRDLDEAVELLRGLADAGDEAAAGRLARLLARRGDLDEAVELLRARADASDEAAAELARLLADRGDLDEAVELLRGRADAGDEAAAGRLADLLAARGDLDELRARADVGDEESVAELAGLLAARGDLDELRARVDTGDRVASWRLAELLADRGDLDEAVELLRARADAGDKDSAGHLANLLADRGDLDRLRALADAGDAAAVGHLANLLANRGDLDEADEAVELLRARADAGDKNSARKLADLLAARGDLKGEAKILCGLADAGDKGAALQLPNLLARLGDLDGLRARAHAGDGYAGLRLVDVLADRGDLDELRARADAGDIYAALRLADRLYNLLIEQGRGEEAERLRHFGFNPDGSIACGWRDVPP